MPVADRSRGVVPVHRAEAWERIPAEAALPDASVVRNETGPWGL